MARAHEENGSNNIRLKNNWQHMKQNILYWMKQNLNLKQV